MIEFLRLLFFSNILLVTPQPIELRGEVELKPLAPLVAINEGASIWIDVSSMVNLSRFHGHPRLGSGVNHDARRIAC